MTREISSDVSPSNFYIYISFPSNSSKSAGSPPDKANVSGLKTKENEEDAVEFFFFFFLACATSLKCFWLATDLKVLRLKVEMSSRRGVAVRGLRCEFKGFCGDAARPHCWDRRAFLLAFIFSRRFTRWLLVISISSILSRDVRSCGWTEGRRCAYSTVAFNALKCCLMCVFTSL